jgi:hypothetical protein
MKDDRAAIIAVTTTEATRTVPAATTEAAPTAPAATIEAARALPSATIEAARAVPAAITKAARTVSAATTKATCAVPAATTEAAPTAPAATIEAARTVPVATTKAARAAPAAPTESARADPATTTEAVTAADYSCDDSEDGNALEEHSLLFSDWRRVTKAQSNTSADYFYNVVTRQTQAPHPDPTKRAEITVYSEVDAVNMQRPPPAPDLLSAMRQHGARASSVPKSRSGKRAAAIAKVAARDKTLEAAEMEPVQLEKEKDPNRQDIPVSWFKNPAGMGKQGPQGGAKVWLNVKELSGDHAVFKHNVWPNCKGIEVGTATFTHQCRAKKKDGTYCNQFMRIARKSKIAGSAFRTDTGKKHLENMHEDLRGAKETVKQTMNAFYQTVYIYKEIKIYTLIYLYIYIYIYTYLYIYIY